MLRQTLEQVLNQQKLTDNQLLEIARRASSRAYCPYSHFAVGSALVTSDGHIYEGCNIENSSYGLAICAERVAIFCAIASGAIRISRIAVSCVDGSTDRPDTLMPCGACRQVMKEFMEPDGPILVDGVGVFTLDQLLPHGFSLIRGA